MEKNIERIDVQEFRTNGFLIFINTILHLFGLVLVADLENNTLYPARTKYRGFSEASMTKMYTNVTNYLAKNIAELQDDIKEG